MDLFFIQCYNKHVQSNELILKILLEFNELEKYYYLLLSSDNAQGENLDLLKLYTDQVQDKVTQLASYLCVLYDFYKGKSIEGVGCESIVCNFISLLLSKFLFNSCLTSNKSNFSRLAILNKESKQENTKANLDQIIELLGKNGE